MPMTCLPSWLDIHHTCFEFWGYPMSYIELLGTVSGLAAVWLAARAHIGTWPVSLVNVSAFFVIFFQVNLYSDMLLQIFFFTMSIYGWINWSGERRKEETVHVLSRHRRLQAAGLSLAAVFLLGALMSRVHLWWPSLFPSPAAYPYPDAFTTVASVLAFIWLSRRILENWVLWIAVDVVSVVLYALKGIYLISLEFAIFLILSVLGLQSWMKIRRQESPAAPVPAQP